MITLLSLLLPPIPLVAAGRPKLALAVYLAWLPSVIVTLGLAHPVFVMIVWTILWSQRQREAAEEEMLALPAPA